LFHRHKVQDQLVSPMPSKMLYDALGLRNLIIAVGPQATYNSGYHPPPPPLPLQKLTNNNHGHWQCSEDDQADHA